MAVDQRRYTWSSHQRSLATALVAHSTPLPCRLIWRHGDLSPQNQWDGYCFTPV